MQLDRRMFLSVSGSAAASSLLPQAARARSASAIKAVAFDAFPILDPRPVFALAERLFPGRGAELGAAWRARQFDYAWLRTLMQRYADFWQVTEEALVFAAGTLKLDLTQSKRRQLMHAYLEIKAWPDVPAALRALREAGIKLAFLSNFTATMLDAGVKNSGLEGVFEPHLSTDRAGAFKPDPRAYRLALDAFGLARDEIAFAAFAGWDAAGAKAFGYPTFWVNRQRARVEALGVRPDAMGADLNDLLKFVLA